MQTFNARLFLFDERDVAIEVTLQDLIPYVTQGTEDSPGEYGVGWILVAAATSEDAEEAARDYAHETATEGRAYLKYMEILTVPPQEG